MIEIFSENPSPIKEGASNKEKEEASLNPGKRFQLSREEFARKRRREVKESTNELQEEYPEVLGGAGLIGSIVIRGTHQKTSDIDAILFIDSESLAERLEKPEEEILDIRMFSTIIENSEAPDYVQKMRKKLEEKLNLSDEQTAHIQEMPISKYIIDQYIQYFLKGDGEWSPERARRLPDSSAIIGRNIYTMFYLETGNDIRKYRKYLLNQLINLKEKGEKMWSNIINHIERKEEYSRNKKEVSDSSKIKYPRTLEKAKKIYLK